MKGYPNLHSGLLGICITHSELKCAVPQTISLWARLCSYKKIHSPLAIEICHHHCVVCLDQNIKQFQEWEKMFQGQNQLKDLCEVYKAAASSDHLPICPDIQPPRQSGMHLLSLLFSETRSPAEPLPGIHRGFSTDEEPSHTIILTLCARCRKGHRRLTATYSWKSFIFTKPRGTTDRWRQVLTNTRFMLGTDKMPIYSSPRAYSIS